MTVTIAYGVATDGYLYAYDPTYATARSGPADGVTAGVSNTNYYGQNNNDSQFAIFQSYIGFTFTAVPATEMVTAAAVCLYQNVQLSTAVARNMEIRGYTWTGGGLTVADWRNSTNLSAAVLYGQVNNVQNSVGKMTAAGTDELVALLQTGQAYAEFVVVSSRQRAGTQATADEGSAHYSADASGTANDPTLVWTSFVRHHFTPVLGAAAQLSDGSTVFLNSGGEAVPTAVTIYRRDTSGAGATTVGSVGTTTNAFDVGPAKGAQGLTIAVDSADNIYVVGKQGSTENTLWVKCWAKNPGVWTWTAGTYRLATLPTYDTAINNVSAAWHSANNGTLMVVAGHTAGAGVSGGTGNELAYALLDTTFIRTGAGTLVRSTGSLLGSILAPTTSAEFNTYANEVGTGLEVTADPVQPTWGYVLSFKKGQLLGENTDLDCGRYILNAAGNGFSHTSYQASVGWGTKDAAGKLRLLAVGDGQVVSITTDKDTAWGLTVAHLQAQGTTSGMSVLGTALMSGESIASMPAGGVIAVAPFWDAVYNSADNSVWIYYRHASIPGRLMRTSFNLNTGQASRLEIQVADVTPLTITSVRAARNANVAQKGLVGITTLTGSTMSRQEVVDAFNIAPTAPTLIPRANYDAAVAATYSWTFADPNPGDTQSAYRLEIRRVDTDAVVVDTGKVTSTTSSHNLAGASLTNNLDYRWRVKVWDAQDADGPYAPWGTFSTSAGGSVTITDPVTDNPDTVITDEIQVSWSVTGTVQASYRVILKRNDTAAVVSDTGWITSTATSYLVTGMATGVEHTVQVQVRNAALVLSGIGSRLITPDYGTPEVPLLTIQPVPDEGYVLVSVDNPISGQPDLATVARDMEDGTTTGFTPFSVTLANSTEQAHSGTHSLKITTTGTPVQAYTRLGSLPTPIIPTERYTARMWVWSATARTIGAALDWSGPGWAYLSTTALDTAVPAGVWTEIQVTGTAPAGCDRVSFGPTLGGSPATGSIIYLDDLILVAASDRPAVVRNRVLRRKLGSGDPWEVLGTCDPDGSFRDYTAPGRVPLEYVVRGESA
jgi:hypothetical protein